MQNASMYTCNIVLHKCIDNFYLLCKACSLKFIKENLTQFKGNVAKTLKSKLASLLPDV